MEMSKDSVFAQHYNFETEPIDIKSYFNDYSKLLYHEQFSSSENTRDFYRRMLGISTEHIKELEEVTDPEKLTCPGEVTPFTFDLFGRISTFSEKYNSQTTIDPEPGKKSLISVQKRKESAKTKKMYPNYYLIYEQFKWCPLDTTSNYRKNLPQNSVIVCAKVYHSFLSSKPTTKVKILQEIHILSSQTLSELKDAISCPLDHVGTSDISNDYFLKEVGIKQVAKNVYPSSFFFIENTFYNDTRAENMKDLSEVIRTWGEKRGLGSFKVDHMQKVTFEDFQFRIGRPYVFQHQGNCEHVFVISDVRFLNATDSTKSAFYPRVYGMENRNPRLCMMCGKVFARILMTGNKRLIHERSYLCHSCFVSYNYVNGVKVGEFEAYEYLDPVAIL